MISTFVEPQVLVEEDWHLTLEGSPGIWLGPWRDMDTNCMFNICFIRCVQKAVEVSGRYNVHPTTTSRSWAGFMNGNRLQKVRIALALSTTIIFCLFSNPVALWLLLEELVWSWLEWQWGRKCDPQGKGEPVGVFTKGNVTQVTPGPSVRWMRHWLKQAVSEDGRMSETEQGLRNGLEREFQAKVVRSEQGWSFPFPWFLLQALVWWLKRACRVVGLAVVWLLCWQSLECFFQRWSVVGSHCPWDQGSSCLFKMMGDLILVELVSTVVDLGVTFLCWNPDDSMAFGLRSVKFWDISSRHRESRLQSGDGSSKTCGVQYRQPCWPEERVQLPSVSSWRALLSVSPRRCLGQLGWATTQCVEHCCYVWSLEKLSWGGLDSELCGFHYRINVQMWKVVPWCKPLRRRRQDWCLLWNGMQNYSCLCIFLREESVALIGFSKWFHDHCPLESLKSLLEILMPGHHSQRLWFTWFGVQPGHEDFLKIPSNSNEQLGLRTSNPRERQDFRRAGDSGLN